MQFVAKDVYGDVHKGPEFDWDALSLKDQERINVVLREFRAHQYLKITVDGTDRFFNPNNIIWVELR